MKKNQKLGVLIGAGVIGLLGLANANSAVILSTIPAVPSTPDGETKISNGFEFPAKMRGISFTTGAKPIHIDSIDYVLRDRSDGPGVEIRLDAGGHPGAGIALPSLTGLTDIGWGSFNRYHYTYASTPFTTTLNANTTYWIMGRSPGPFGRWLWEGFNTTASTGSATIGSVLDSNNGGGTWVAPSDSLTNLFQINGTAIPEPSTAGVIVVGLGMLLGKRKSRPTT